MNSRTLACVFLRETVGLANERFQALVLKLGGPEAVWDAPPRTLLDTGLFTDEQLAVLLKQREDPSAVGHTLTELAKSGLHAISCFDPDYPAGLLSLAHPPSVLYRRGRHPDPGTHLFVVGARAADCDAIALAVEVGKRLAALGVVLVSNLSEGVEVAAHVGALSGAGRHVVLLPSGHDVAAQLESGAVLSQVSEAGASYSEYAPGVTPNAERRTDACRLALGASQGALLLGEVDEHLAFAVTSASLSGKPVFYIAGGPAAEAGVLRREGAYPIAGTEHLERILPLL